MKLKLEAFSPGEGIGIIRSNQTLRLIRPPYLSHDSPVLAEDSLQHAILQHGFFASTAEFDAWEDVIAFLNQQASIVRKALGKSIPSVISGRDIVDVATLEVLNDFLNRVETEIIPQRMFDHAEDFLLAVLAGGVLTAHPEVGTKAATLLQRNKEARKKAEARISDLANRDIRFPSLEKRGELERSLWLAEVIRERGCVFSPAS